MSLPLRHLPVVQNWDCHSCSNCCRELEVPVTEEERTRIEAQSWDQDPELGKLRRIVRKGPWWAWWTRRYRLNHKPNGGCVFLSDTNRCRIHERFGAEAKPLACRLYPFVLVPCGDHWRVSLRFACPSAAQNQGRPLREHSVGVSGLARLLERQEALQGREVAPPLLSPGVAVDWPDVNRLVQALLGLLSDRTDRVERRLRKCLALAELCRQARFDKLSGGRLTEFLDLLTGSLDAEVPQDPAVLEPPGWIGRVLFRQLLVIYGRKDWGENRGPVTRSRLRLLRAAWRFARGRGQIPAVNGAIGSTTFEQVEGMTGKLSEAAEETLERYYRVKVESLQFCGPLNFGLPFWDGLEALAATFPAILWWGRALGSEQAIPRAMALVDDHFGFNRVLGSRRIRFALRTLARRGELARLIAWYSR